MDMTILFACVTVLLYGFHKRLTLPVFHKVLGITLFLDLFYLIGHYVGGWPFPTPTSIVHITLVVALGVALGVVFSGFWPLPEKVGFERVFRTVLIAIPALGPGIGLQLLLQGPEAMQALYLLFPLSAWIGSCLRIEDEKENEEEETEEQTAVRESSRGV